MWNLHLDTKQVLLLWKTTQKSLRTINFSYVFAEINKQFSEYSAKKLGTTCNLTAAIRMLRRFLNNWFWKTRYCYFLYKCTKKRNNPYKELSRDNDRKNLCNTVAIQVGQPRNLLWSSSSIRTEDGGRKSLVACVCQLLTWRIFISCWRHEFSVWENNCQPTHL